MLSLFKNLPIFRRLFLAFFLAVVIPDTIIILMGSIYIQVLNAHGIGSSQTVPLILATAVALMLSTAVVITLGYIVNSTITQPLRQLVALTRRIRQGETGARVSITGRDEISMVAASMNSMLDNIVQLIQQTERQRDGLQFQVEKLVSEVSGVGEGDLRIQAEVTSDSLGVLADSFNYMVEELSNLVVRVKMVAQEVELSATNTSKRMIELVRIADSQIQQIGVAAEQVEQMAQFSGKAAERVQRLDEAAGEARLSAHNGLSTVQRTIERMGRINTNVQETASQVLILQNRSREIDEIVDVISGIANSTNRLALDATVQGAMAGVHGRGFQAVADDIRRLAERSKEQTTLITRHVQSVREDMETATRSMRETAREVSEGATLVQETEIAFGKIYAVVEQQAQEFETINQVVRILLQAASSVAQIMQSVSNSTQHSSASTRDVAEHMALLARRAEQLLHSVEAFKLREDTTFSRQRMPRNNVTGRLGR